MISYRATSVTCQSLFIESLAIHKLEVVDFFPFDLNYSYRNNNCDKLRKQPISLLDLVQIIYTAWFMKEYGGAFSNEHQVVWKRWDITTKCF